jgi:hypothetical protein
MNYEKPQIIRLDDAGKAIQLMSKLAPIKDNHNGTELPPSVSAYEANE